MNFLVRLSPNARRDRDRIVAYYDDPERLQGDRFLDDFYRTARLLEKHPGIGRIVGGDVRRWHLGIFPHQLWYRVDPDTTTVRVIAVVADAQDHRPFADRLA